MASFRSREAAPASAAPYDSLSPLVYGFRSWLYMFLNLFLGLVYFGGLAAVFPLGFALVTVWVGLPVLAVALVLTRRIAAIDRWFAAKMIGIEQAPVLDDLDDQRIDLLNMMGAHLTSMSSWQSAAYLMLKLPLGIASFTLASLLTPLFLLELLLSLLNIPTGMVISRIMRALAGATTGVQGRLIPAEPMPVRYVRVPVQEVERVRTDKAKRRLSAEDEYDDPYGIEYVFDDDGEISVRRRSEI
jgi:hypothetical protein